MKPNRKGFTILELLVVVAIIAIIAVIAIPNFIGRIDEAKDSRELAEINAVTKAISTYYADNGVYPTLQGKDGTVLQAQPIEGSPHNIDFSSLVPNYLTTLPHFSYWWVDSQGKIYHTEKPIGSVTGSVFTPQVGYSYKLNGSTVLSAPYTLQSGDYIVGKDDKGVDLPKISSAFKNEKMHPEDPAYVPVVVVTSQSFAYTGAVQTYTIPATGTYSLEVWGASGGYYTPSSATSARGGYAKGEMVLSAGQVLNIYVGGRGTNSAAGFLPGGWNGGGNVSLGYDNNCFSSSGGGGTDVRIGGTALTNRVIVAGGGGGSGYNGHYSTTFRGGEGGGLTGILGYFVSDPYTSGGYGTGKGGTQTAGGAQGAGGFSYAQAGSLGQGGNNTAVLGGSWSGSAGGGGYYGGGSGNAYGLAGGGGSSYVGTLSNASTVSGNATMPSPVSGTMVGNDGAGAVKITKIN